MSIGITDWSTIKHTETDSSIYVHLLHDVVKKEYRVY